LNPVALPTYKLVQIDVNTNNHDIIPAY